MYLIQLDNLAAEKDGVTGKGGVLVTQERIIDADMAKVGKNTKADANDALDSSKIDTPKINVK